MLMRPLFFFFGFILLLGPLLEAKTVECKPQEKGSEKNEDKDESSEDKKDEKDEEDSDDKDDDKDKEDDKDKKKDDSDADNTVKWGNLALSASQQPGPLVGFGQNMIDAGKWQVLWFGDYIRGKNHYSIDEIPGILYGISDDCSIFFNFPFAARIKEGPNHSSGLEDFFVQLEYAVYTKASTFYTDQVTVVANVSLPTGSSHSNPPTGLGTSSYFTGVTYSHTNVAYMFFTAYGALITTSRCDFRQGNVYLYQLGYVKNINYIPEKWIFSWMVEVNGYYYDRNKVSGVFDRNTGGNVITMTPSLWMSTDHFLIQLGTTVPLLQTLYGEQERADYSLVFNVGWLF